MESALDAAARSMATGMLVGQRDGRLEFLVTLDRDESLGVEVRVALEDGKVVAEFLPGDWTTFRDLRDNQHLLLKGLEEKGLQVSEILIREPD